jgi:predicted amidohydrolase YtcJ
MSLLITGASRCGGARVDVRVADGIVTDLAPRLAGASFDDVIDAAGGALIPGLHDHHLHLFAMAAARASTPCGPPHVTSVAALAAALREAPGDGWIRGVGYHESVAGDLDRDVLDQFVPHRPVRVQHRSGALWLLNSTALDALGITAGTEGVETDHSQRPTGRLWRADLLTRATGGSPPDLSDVGRDLLALGITGVTDATPDLDDLAMKHLETAIADGTLPQTVTALGAPDDWRSDRVKRGPRKLLLADHDLPPFDDLVDRIRQAHAADRAVAVHCVTRESLVLTVAALDTAGVIPGDRIEHAAVVPPELRAGLATRGLTVVTQPRFIAERGDTYLATVDTCDHDTLYPYASLLDAGVTVAPSSDAPYADPDPWLAMVAATDRRTTAGKIVGISEAVPARTVLSGYLSSPDGPGGPPRTITPGQRADLCLLAVPLVEALRAPARDNVRLAITGDRLYDGQPGGKP